MPSIELRPRQMDVVMRTGESFRCGHQRPLIYAPCGFGKTCCFCYFCSRITEREKRVIILAHREELLEQISRTLSAFDVNHGFIAAGLPYDWRPLVHVASVFTLVRRLESITPPDYIIVDEAQHCISTSTWGRVIAAFPLARVIGVSGSPIRFSGEALGDVFDDLILGPSTSDLIHEGLLANYRLFAPADIDRTQLHTRMGDFVKAEVSGLMDRPSIVGDAVSEWKKHAAGLKTATFCVSVEHAYHIAEEYRKAGVNALAVDGGMDRATRRKVISEFRSGSLQLIASCDLLSEGWDVPNIFCGQFLRPTASLGLYIQQVGRCIRSAPGKEYAVLLDHVGNTRVHGPIDQSFEWSLEGNIAKKRKKRNDEAPKIRTCQKCTESYGLHVRVCRCGELLVQSREIDERDGELSEIDPQQLKRSRMREQGSAKDLQSLIAFGRSKNYKHPEIWARMVMRAREEKAAARAAKRVLQPPAPEPEVQETEEAWLF